jgi:hypothetical protein
MFVKDTIDNGRSIAVIDISGKVTLYLCNIKTVLTSTE